MKFSDSAETDVRMLQIALYFSGLALTAGSVFVGCGVFQLFSLGA